MDISYLRPYQFEDTMSINNHETLEQIDSFQKIDTLQIETVLLIVHSFIKTAVFPIFRQRSKRSLI